MRREKDAALGMGTGCVNVNMAETVEENIHPVEDSFHVTQRRCETPHHSNIVTLWL